MNNPVKLKADFRFGVPPDTHRGWRFNGLVFWCMVLFVLLGCCGTAPVGYTQTPEQKPVWDPLPKTLAPEQTSSPPLASFDTYQLRAMKTQFLPDAMYGTWNIRAVVMESNAPPAFILPETIEIWALSRTQEEVFIENVTNHAVATVAVDKVEGNTATFHHEADNDRMRMKIIETPTVTVDKDRMYGVNRQKIMLLNRRRQPVQVFDLVIRVEGTRLSGGRVQFGQSTKGTHKQFEVAPLQYE